MEGGIVNEVIASSLAIANGASRPLRYALITPARNEAACIRHTLGAVTRQTRPPVRWLIISDGSTDGTDDIVNEYRQQFDWIDLMRMPERRDRSFAAKAQCFNAGFERLRGVDFDIIGSLDADMSFAPDYFEFLLTRFENNPRLGVAGTPFGEDGVQYDFRFSNIEHVSGACQLFRRQCFHDIGGYVPIRTGGIDWAAVTTARMKGWQTRTFPERAAVHHKPMRTGSKTLLGSIFRLGQQDYYLGGHPLWELFRSVYQISRPPYVVGGLFLWAGYSWALLRRAKRPVSEELMRFHRSEQMARLKRFFRIGMAGASTTSPG
jgi:poly-beta-1,6-N-acetyl-D-glucosamine synthase